MSHHLKVLASANWIRSRREGNSIFYRRAHIDPTSSTSDLQQQLFDTLDAQPLSAEVASGINLLQTERGALSQQFFSDNADKFREQQDLIASYPAYGEQVLELLDQTPLAHYRHALELGPGEGDFLLPLAERFNKVTALDNSSAMLERAKEFAANASNVDYICSDTQALEQYGIKVDCAVVNMVLHHTPNPREIFAQLSNALNSGGVLIVTDLCRHDQSWVRDACGDLWQGFEPDDFSAWACDSGLREGQAMYFALRNGFQIQIRQFFKH